MNGAIPVGIDAQYGGSAENRTPEHLFTAAILNCFLASFQIIAGTRGLVYDAIEARADAKVEKSDGTLWVSECRIDATIHGCADRAQAGELLDRAERACIIKNSVKTSVTITTAFSDAL